MAIRLKLKSKMRLKGIRSKLKSRLKKKNYWKFTILPGIQVDGSNLEPVMELTQGTMVPLLEPPLSANFTICDQLVKNCYDLSYIPKSKTFIMSDGSFCRLVDQQQVFLNNVSQVLNVDSTEAGKQIAKFFEDHQILVQPTGVQGAFYKVATYLQSGGSALLVARTITMAKAAGATGAAVIKTQPMLLVAIPTTGAIFFHGLGMLAGNNTFGRTCDMVGNFFILPMHGFELTYNAYIGPFVNKTVGFPTYLNYTQQVMRGPGFSVSEAQKLLAQGQKNTVVKQTWNVVKNFIIKRLGGTPPA